MCALVVVVMVVLVGYLLMGMIKGHYSTSSTLDRGSMYSQGAWGPWGRGKQLSTFKGLRALPHLRVEKHTAFTAGPG